MDTDEVEAFAGLLDREDLLGEIRAELTTQPGAMACLVLVNVDRLNTINHALGHPEGDAVLEVIAERLRDATRQNDALCHLGGDQFAVLLRKPATPNDAVHAARRFLELARETIDVSGKPVITSVSIGISRSQVDSTVESLLREADAALGEAKRAGRNRYELFDGALKRAAETRARLEGQLRLALSEGQLLLHYQPEVDLLTGHVVGVEALVRWEHPDHGLLSADAFVPLAEETGIVTELGHWVVNEACQSLARWSALFPSLGMRVNLSAVQLTRRQLVQEIEGALLAGQIAPSRLCLELTETAVMTDPTRSVEILEHLAELGVRIAIDDFGTGFSSLAHLHRLPAHVLKIDQSFVAELGGPSGVAIVGAIVALADALGLEVVAEGVENQHQRDLLLSKGVRRAQGHLYAPALNEAELLDWLARAQI